MATYIGTCSALLVLQRHCAGTPGALRFTGDRLLPLWAWRCRCVFSPKRNGAT